MAYFRLGVPSNAFGRPARESVKIAQRMGADGIQLYTVSGEMAPENLDTAARKEFRGYCEAQDIELSALCGDRGGRGLLRPDEIRIKTPRLKLIVDLARDLGTHVVTMRCGVVPESTRAPEYKVMVEACRLLGNYAASHEVRFAIETGSEPAERLRDFLFTVDSDGMGVNLDPANFVMILGYDPVRAVQVLDEFIVHARARDGNQLRQCEPVEVYESFVSGEVDDLLSGEYFEEVPLGEGSVDWPAYLRALEEVGYHGYLTIARETGADPEGDIRKAVKFLKTQVARL